jgi:hypothetical protein
MMVAVGVAAALAISACDLEADPDGDGADVVGEGTGTESTPEAEDTGAAAGARENPLGAGIVFEVGDWTVEFGETNLDADGVVADENEFNEPPVDGRRFVMVGVAVSYVGQDSGQPWVDLGIEFYGSGGNTFGTGEDDYCGVVPDDLLEIGEMFPDASASGNVCVSVPADQIEGGAWLVEDTWALDDPDRTFVALQ